MIKGKQSYKGLKSKVPAQTIKWTAQRLGMDPSEFVSLSIRKDVWRDTLRRVVTSTMAQDYGGEP